VFRRQSYSINRPLPTRNSGKKESPTFLSLYIEYFIWHGSHRKHHVQRFFYCCVCICCDREVFVEPLPSKDRLLWLHYSCFQALGRSHRQQGDLISHFLFFKISHSRAIGQAVSRWLPTPAARVRDPVWSSGICGGQIGTGAGFLRVLRFSLPNLYFTKFSILTITRGRYNRPISCRRVEWTQFGLHPPLWEFKKKLTNVKWESLTYYWVLLPMG
jgi:hypothetical protein